MSTKTFTFSSLKLSAMKFNYSNVKMALIVSGDPMVTVVLLTAKDNGSMVRDDHLNEAERLTAYLISNHSVQYENQPVTYEDFCSPYCMLNIAIKLFKVVQFPFL